MAGWPERAFQVNGDDRIPFRFGHVGEHTVPEDARIVDDHVERSIGVDRRGDQVLCTIPGRDVIAVGDGRSAGRLDLVDDGLRGSRVATGAVHVPAEIVHDDPGTLFSEHQRVLTADSSAGPGDDADAVLADSHAGSSVEGVMWSVVMWSVRSRRR